jgi:4-amino-4-deoxy-L-arabinose transferase-like glycosyltransferase
VLRFLVGTGLALVIFLQGSSAPFSNTAESQEALVVWEMSDSGDWVLPRVNGMLIPSKPPLYHWFALAFSTLTGGPDERAARLPSIVFGAVTVGVVFAVGAAEWGAATGAIAAVVLATSPEWVKWATTARTDATFACFLTIAFLLAERWLRTGEDRLLVAFAAAAGAATLAKGFAAAGLLGLVVAIEIWRRSGRRWPRPTALATAALVFGAIAVSWYAAALAKAGFAFFHKQIVLENVLRFLPNAEGGPSRKHARLFYVPMLLVGMLPWSVALPTALARGFRERRTVSGGSAFAGYLLTWFAVVFAVCTLASGKRTNYILPLYPAAALLIARDLGVALANARAGGSARALRVAGYAGAVLILALAALLAAWSSGGEPWTPMLHWLHAQDQILLPRMAAIIGAPPAWTVALVALLGVGLATATARRAWNAAYAIVGASAVLVTFVGCRFVPVLEAEIKSFAPFSQRAVATVENTPLAFYPTYDFAILYYLRRHVPVVDRAGFAALRRPSYALVFAPDWDRLSDTERAGAKIVDTSIPASIGRPSWRWLLVRLDPAGGSPAS